MSRQHDLFPELIVQARAARRENRRENKASENSTGFGQGWLRRDARDSFPNGQPPIRTDPQRAWAMLYTLCDLLEYDLSDPVSIQCLSIGGKDVWVFGLTGYRISQPLQTISVLKNLGDGTVVEIDGEFSFSRPFDSPDPYIRMVNCIYPALVPENEPWPIPPIDEHLRDWLADSVKVLLHRHPVFRDLITRRLPFALRLHDPLRLLCLRSRPFAVGPSLESTHVKTVLAQKAHYDQVARENPKLLPLLTAFLDAGHPLYEEVDCVFQLREAICGAGHSEAAWRYLCRHGASLFKVPWRLSPSQSAWKTAMLYLSTLQAAWLPPPPPPSVCVAWLSAFNAQAMMGTEIRILESFPTAMEPRILRAALLEADRRRHDMALREFIPEFLGVCWWATQSSAKLDSNQAHAGWQWLVKQWKASQLLQEVLAVASRSVWRTRSGQVAIGSWQVVPLASSDAMIRESFALRNCLQDHIPLCEVGLEEFYSVRCASTGKSKARFGFRFDGDGGADFIDVKGYANSKVGNELTEIATSFDSRLTYNMKVLLAIAAHENVKTGDENNQNHEWREIGSQGSGSGQHQGECGTYRACDLEVTVNKDIDELTCNQPDRKPTGATLRSASAHTSGDTYLATSFGRRDDLPDDASIRKMSSKVALTLAKLGLNEPVSLRMLPGRWWKVNVDAAEVGQLWEYGCAYVTLILSSERLAAIGIEVVDGPFEDWANMEVSRAILGENSGKYWDACISNRPLLPVIDGAEQYAGYDNGYTSEDLLAALDAGKAVKIQSGPFEIEDDARYALDVRWEPPE